MDQMSLQDAVSNVARTWMMVPTVNHYLAPDDPAQWPTAWELISENIYCDLSIALGMYYSLALSIHSESDLSIQVYDDPIQQRWYNLCVIGAAKTATNLEAGVPVNSLTLPETASLKFHYKHFDLASRLG